MTPDQRRGVVFGPPPPKDLPGACYHCAQHVEVAGLAIQLPNYAQIFCGRCLGMMLEYVSESMREGGRYKQTGNLPKALT